MTRSRHIVIVDDEPNIGRSLRLILEGEGYSVTVCDSAARVSGRAAPGPGRSLPARRPAARRQRHRPAAALRQNDDATPAVMISGHATIRDAVEATRSGAFDFLEKPLARDRVLLVAKNALERSDLQRENQRFRELVGDAPKMIGRAPPFQHAVQQATQVARSDVSVLLIGRVGHGQGAAGGAHPSREPVRVRPVRQGQLRRHPDRADRERAVRAREGRVHRRGGAAARQVRARRRRHDLSRRSRRPARGVAGQAAARSCRTASCSASAASSRSASRARHLGHQPSSRRADRRGQVPRGPLLPPERRADPRARAARATAGHRRAGDRTSSPSSARATTSARARSTRTSCPLLERYDWPGNVRELRNVVERMAILTRGDRITVESIPLEIRLPQPRAPTRGCRRFATPPNASASARRSIRPTGTSPAPPACWAPNAPACTSGSARSD